MDILKKRKTERLKKLASAKDREISALKDEMKILMDENARLALHGEAYKEAEGRLREAEEGFLAAKAMYEAAYADMARLKARLMDEINRVGTKRPSSGRFRKGDGHGKRQRPS